MTSDTYTGNYLAQTINIINHLDVESIENAVEILVCLRASTGRLFICGVGGSAGHASHAVNDFRKICGIESYSPTDNVSELTARTNDEGWDTFYLNWLKVSRLCSEDCLMFFSVGGGDMQKNVSVGLMNAINYATDLGAPTIAIVGRDGGHIGNVAKCVVNIPPIYPLVVTPHTEGLTAVIWHLFVSHPKLQINSTTW